VLEVEKKSGGVYAHGGFGYAQPPCEREEGLEIWVIAQPPCEREEGLGTLGYA